MNRSVVAIGLTLLAALAAAAIVFVANESEGGSDKSTDGPSWFDQSADTDARLRALETAVAEERNARQLLEEELQFLYEELDNLAARNERPDQSVMSDEERVAQIRENRQRLEQSRQRPDDEQRIARLVEAGMSPDRAERLVKRESELRMQSMQAMFAARASGEPFDPANSARNPQAALRAEIGDAEYEQYLQASGRPTVVEVTSILESSPAQRAGIQPGDQITAYNGTRVFDTGELYRHTMQGEPGDTVVVDILRDGVPMQIVLPSGPIGVMLNRSRGRR